MSERLTLEWLAEKRRIAEAATPGPWEVYGPDYGSGDMQHATGVCAEDEYRDEFDICRAPGERDEAAESADMEYIAAFDPPTVLALLDEIERLRGDVRQWMCDHCDVVYPGPPADGVWCVVCSRCGGDTAPRTLVERWRLQRALDRLSAENARLISDIKMITAPVEVGGGADAYLRAEIERLRRERAVLADALQEIKRHVHGHLAWYSRICPDDTHYQACTRPAEIASNALLDGEKGGGGE